MFGGIASAIGLTVPQLGGLAGGAGQLLGGLLTNQASRDIASQANSDKSILKKVYDAVAALFKKKPSEPTPNIKSNAPSAVVGGRLRRSRKINKSNSKKTLRRSTRK